MSAPIILYKSESLLPFFPEGIIKNIYYQLTVERLKTLSKENNFKRKRSNSRENREQVDDFIKIISEDIDSALRINDDYRTIEMNGFMNLFQSMTRYAEQRPIFVRDGFYQPKSASRKIAFRVVSEHPNDDLNIRRRLFAPAKKSLPFFKPEIYIVDFPKYLPDEIFPKEENISRFATVGNKESPTLLSNVPDSSLLINELEQIILQLVQQ